MRNLVLIVLLAVMSTVCSSQTPGVDPNWLHEFSDDFDNPNPNYWHYNDWDDFAGSSHRVVALDANLIYNYGSIILRTKKENVTCPSQFQNTQQNNPCFPCAFWKCQGPNYNYEYTTGKLTTQSQAFHFGYYEANIKSGFAPGHWPAFWITAHKFQTSYTEIDIFEHIGKGGAGNCASSGQLLGVPQMVYDAAPMDQFYTTTNVHTAGHATSSGDWEYPAAFPINDYTNWHKYGLEWLPNRITWLIDDKVVRILRNMQNFDEDQPMFVILNGMVDRGLEQAYSHWTGYYPVDMIVDYFRYYRLNTRCQPAVSQICYDFNTHTDIGKSSYDIGPCTGGVTAPNGNFIFRANDYILINGDFTVPLGAEAYFDAIEYCTYGNRVINNQCGPIFNPCNFNLGNYDNSKKHIIELAGDNTCSIIVQPTDDVHLKANEYINLKPGFSVPQNSELEAITVTCP